MEWLSIGDWKNQEYTILRLYAPKSERILLDFQPLKQSDDPNWDPKYEEWYRYPTPLRVYRQDYEKLLMVYFKKIYPIRDAFNGNLETYFDVCFDNWIGKKDWMQFISDIKKDMHRFSDSEKIFYQSFLIWLEDALKYTEIIIVEGNC